MNRPPRFGLLLNGRLGRRLSGGSGSLLLLVWFVLLRRAGGRLRFLLAIRALRLALPGVVMTQPVVQHRQVYKQGFTSISLYGRPQIFKTCIRIEFSFVTSVHLLYRRNGMLPDGLVAKFSSAFYTFTPLVL